MVAKVFCSVGVFLCNCEMVAWWFLTGPCKQPIPKSNPKSLFKCKSLGFFSLVFSPLRKSCQQVARLRYHPSIFLDYIIDFFK